MRPRLLDLFCCAGGSAMGWWRAGFDVVGVDTAPQPDYPFEFHRADALTFPLDGFAVVTGSPPCKVHTPLRHTTRGSSLFDVHEDLIGATRDRFIASGLPYVIENVVGARDVMVDPVTYCGSSFGLQVRRHRLFESNLPIVPPLCDHSSQPIVLGVYGTGGADSGRAKRGGGGGVKVSGKAAADAMGIDWTTDQKRLSQMIPPPYTEHIGRQLIEQLSGRCDLGCPSEDPHISVIVERSQ